MKALINIFLLFGIFFSNLLYSQSNPDEDDCTEINEPEFEINYINKIGRGILCQKGDTMKFGVGLGGEKKGDYTEDGEDKKSEIIEYEYKWASGPGIDIVGDDDKETCVVKQTAESDDSGSTSISVTVTAIYDACEDGMTIERTKSRTLSYGCLPPQTANINCRFRICMG